VTIGTRVRHPDGGTGAISLETITLMDAKKRILILTHEFPPFLGGVGTYGVEIARAAAELGHEVTVFAPDFGADNSAADALLPFTVERFPASLYTRKSLAICARRLLRRDMAAYDIVHFADWPFVLASRIAGILRPLRYQVMVHGTDVLLLKKGTVPRLLNAGRALAKADRLLANSRYTLSLAQRSFPEVEADRCAVTLLGVGQNWFSAPGDIASLRARYAIKPERAIILSVSRLDERKGHRHALAALARLDPADKARLAYVVVGKAGDPAYAEELKRTAAGLGLPVVFTGPLPEDEVRTLYGGSLAFLLLGEEQTEKIEGFGLVFLEAAAQGLPSVAAPVGGVPEVVLHEKTGLLVDARASDAAAAAISRLLNDEAARTELGRNALEWARQMTWRRCAELTFQ